MDPDKDLNKQVSSLILSVVQSYGLDGFTGMIFGMNLLKRHPKLAEALYKVSLQDVDMTALENIVDGIIEENSKVDIFDRIT